MKSVDTIARVHREHFVRGRSIKEISRDLHVSRNTVRKILRSGETQFSYERDVQPMPKIGPRQGDLDRLLLGNDGKPARERLTLSVSSRRCAALASRAALMPSGATRKAGRVSVAR